MPKLKNDDNKRYAIILIILVALFFSSNYFLNDKKEENKVIEIVKVSTTTPQFVLLSFDGSKSVDMWKDTITFSSEMKEKGVSIKFTYFINSIYLLSPQNANRYMTPQGQYGQSAIGFAENADSIQDRIKEINKAIIQGHEIASHAVGHWSGGNWSVGEWNIELKSFEDLLFNYRKNNPEKIFDEDILLTSKDIKGFRAPELSINKNMYRSLYEQGYKYDSSEVARYDKWPKKDKNGIWHVPISTVHFNDMKRDIIAVDYSIWVHQTNTTNTLKKGTLEWQKALDAIVSAFVIHFYNNYNTDKAPMVLDNHFSTWNDGLYFEAMKKFATEVCVLKDVRCGTFSDLVKYMEQRTGK